MAAHRGEMALQSLVALGIGRGVVVVFESLQRHLCVDDHITVVGEVENDIGDHLVSVLFVNRAPLLVFQCHLLFELHALFESHLFQQCAQTQLAEVALCLILAGECLRQLICSLSDLVCLLQVFLNAGIEARHQHSLVMVALLHGFLHLLQVFM